MTGTCEILLGLRTEVPLCSEASACITNKMDREQGVSQQRTRSRANYGTYP
jgi:hypothetical protein